MPKDKRRGGAGRLLHLNVGNVLCGIAVVILFIAIGTKLAPVFRTSPRIITASTLTDVVDIAELSTAEFTYTGIAEAYKDAEHKNLLCHIRYTAVVKAGITMSDIVFEVNHDSKTVTATLPEIKLTAYIADESKLSLMPSNPDINLHDLIAGCTGRGACVQRVAFFRGRKHQIHRERVALPCAGQSSIRVDLEVRGALWQVSKINCLLVKLFYGCGRIENRSA
jgi:hypothetical protein